MSKVKLVALVAALVLFLPAVVCAAPQAGDVVFTVGQAAYQYDGETIPMSAAPVIINGRTYLPVRDVARALGLSVAWNPVNKTVMVDPSTGTTISGTFSWGIPLTVSIANGSKITATLDTGASLSAFPEEYLKGLGYKPISTMPIVLPSGLSFFNIYKVPCPVVWNKGVAMPLGSGYIQAIGLSNTSSSLIGIDIISKLNLSLDKGKWTLILPKT